MKAEKKMRKIQALLALVFLFTGGTKLILPLEVLTSMGAPIA